MSADATDVTGQLGAALGGRVTIDAPTLGWGVADHQLLRPRDTLG